MYVNVFEFGQLEFVEALRHLCSGADFVAAARGNDSVLRQVAKAFAQKFSRDKAEHRSNSSRASSSKEAFLLDQDIVYSLAHAVLSLNSQVLGSGQSPRNSQGPMTEFSRSCRSILGKFDEVRTPRLRIVCRVLVYVNVICLVA